MKAFTERNPRLIGLVAAALTIVAVSAVLVVNKSIFASTYTVDARFADTAGVVPGTPVLLAGVPVGSVGTVALAGNGVDTTLDINHGVVLPAQTAAAISVETVLGNLGVVLEPLRGWSHPLVDGSAVVSTTVPVELYQVQNEAGTLLSKTDAHELNRVISSLEQITAGKQRQVSQIVHGLNGITGVVNQRQAQVGQLIDAATTLSDTVAQRDQQLASTVSNLSTVVGGLAQRSTDLGALIDNTQQAAAQLSTLVGGNQPQISQLIQHLDSVLGVLAHHQLDLAQGISSAASAVTGFASIGSSGSAPNPGWANVYTNLVGASGALGVLGNCGALDQVLNQALGPDPLPCNQQSGPPVPATLPTPAASAQPATSAAGAGSSGGSQGGSSGSPASGAPAAGAGSGGTGGTGGTGTGSGSSTAGTPPASLGGLLQQLLGSGS